MISNQYSLGDPFGLVVGNKFIFQSQNGNSLVLVEDGVVTDINTNFSQLDWEEMLPQINEVYPAVTTYEFSIGSYSVGQEVNISETI